MGPNPKADGAATSSKNIAGDFDLFADIISKKGFDRFKAYISTLPSLTLCQLRIVMAAFAEKFSQTEKIIEELEAPGWDHTLVQDLTDLSDDDLKDILKILSVRFILP